MENFTGYHSEWNLGSPGGWDYQRLTQEIGKAVWQQINRINPAGVELDFDNPYFSPVHGLVDIMVEAHRSISGSNTGLIAVVAEEETLADVTENINLAGHLDHIEGIRGVLCAPHELEQKNGRVCWKGQPVSVIFMDFNTDVLMKLHRKHDLSPVLQAVGEKRVINPRGTEPFNIKSMFEIITGPFSDRSHESNEAGRPHQAAKICLVLFKENVIFVDIRNFFRPQSKWNFLLYNIVAFLESQIYGLFPVIVDLAHPDTVSGVTSDRFEHKVVPILASPFN